MTASEPRTRAWRRALTSLDATDLALRLTLVALLLRPVGDAQLRPGFMLLAAAGLVLPGLLRAPLLWALLAGLAGLRLALDWPLADNHAYLLAYWLLAVALALLLEPADPRVLLGRNARLLIGLAFAFAVVWKLALSPDYRDGTFFRVMLVSDARLETVAHVAGGLSPEALSSLRARIERHTHGPPPGPPPPPVPARLGLAAGAASVWTAGLEIAVAVAFLAGRPLRDPLLLLFCATTYAVAPVRGFGWLLLAMGAAQAPPRPALRLGYLAVFASLVLLALLPWVSG